ncbi:MAG: phospholipase [Bacteroidetes bacterium]|jgi:predicted esterase|nr:phospholipase [Bacteroidota bacterium]
MDHHKISVEKSARYFTLGKSDSNITTVFFVCHGYAQSANEFLEKFEPIQNDKYYFVAPEGLSRFYLRGSKEKVVASWMTHEDRADDISDYVLFLDKVYKEVIGKFSSDVNIILLGFSQGAATASRWAALGNSRIDKLILWCGFFPTDLATGGIPERIDLTVVAASNDRWISAKQEEEQVERIKLFFPAMKHIQFEGEHEIDIPTLKKIIWNL